MSIDKFIYKNRAEINKRIKALNPDVKLNDAVRRYALLNEPSLYEWFSKKRLEAELARAREIMEHASVCKNCGAFDGEELSYSTHDDDEAGESDYDS